MKDLDQQLSEYKTMVAELTRDNRALKNLIEKKLYRQRVKEMRLIT
jgi:putative transposase